MNFCRKVTERTAFCIETTGKKLEKNSALQNYFNYNHLFKLKKILEKEEKVLNHWLEKLLKGQKEYYELV